MAVVTGKSAAITNRDAVPRVKNNPQVAREFVREAIGYAALASGDSIASKYILVSIPSNARVAAVKVFCSAITSAAADIGLYRTTDDGSAVVQADFFAAAQTIATANYTGIDVTYTAAGLNGIAFCEQPVWQQLGLAADPNIMYDVVATLTAATTAAGKLALRCAFVE